MCLVQSIVQLLLKPIEMIDIVFDFVYKILYPLRAVLYLTGGFIYTLYEFTLALIFRIPTNIICLIEGWDNRFFDRCSNARNGAIMLFLYKWVSLILFPIRIITYIPAICFFSLFTYAYLVPCPVLRMEALIDPITHRKALRCSYPNIFGIIHPVPFPSELIVPIKNICKYISHPFLFITQLAGNLLYL